MNILCISPGYFPAVQYGGVVTSVHNLNKGLVRQGCRVTVFATRMGIEDKVPAGIEQDLDGVKIIYLDAVKFFERIGQWHYMPRLSKMVRQRIAEFDVVHIHSIWNYAAMSVAGICRKNRKPYVVAPRGMLYPETIRKNSIIKRMYFNLFIKILINGAGKIHFTSLHEANHCADLSDDLSRRCVVYNAFDIDEISRVPTRSGMHSLWPSTKNKKVILILGRINWKKGFDILIPAFAALYRQRSNVHLLIAGNEEPVGYSEIVRSMIRNAGLKFCDGDEIVSGAVVTFAGMLTGEKKMAAYSGADLFVLPSYSENFGNVVVEAMACGVPVIVSDQVGIAEEIKQHDAGIIVPASQDELESAMQFAMETPNAMEQKVRNATLMITTLFSLSVVIESMMTVYNSLLSVPGSIQNQERA